MKRALRHISGAAVTCLVLTMLPMTAHANDAGDDVGKALQRAINEVDAVPAAVNDRVDLPLDADEPALVKFQDGATLEMSIPATANLESAQPSTVVFSDADSHIAVQSTQEGLRALIHIESPGSPERFKFEMGGDVAELKITSDGDAIANDANGEVIAVAPAPWAVDATGKAVPTHFEVDGKDLYQVISHRGGEFNYGIVADPWWNPLSWPWGKWVKKSSKAVTKVLKKCDVGAMRATLGLAGGTTSVNVMLKHVAGKRMIMVAGGGYGYLTIAAAGCIENNL